MCNRSVAPGTSTVLRGNSAKADRVTAQAIPSGVARECVFPCRSDALERSFIDTLRIVFEVVEFGHHTQQLGQVDMTGVLVRVSLRELEADVVDVLPCEAHDPYLPSIFWRTRKLGIAGERTLSNRGPLRHSHDIVTCVHE